MNAQHTQGRLTVAGPTIQGGEDACGVPLALAHMLNPYAGAAGAADRVEANARRLVACWNACEGMEDPEAEVSALRKDSEYLMASERLRAKAIEQRDELLAALEDAVSVCRSISISRDRRIVRDGCTLYAQTEEWCKWVEDEIGPKLIAAIAKVKGGAV